jgi:hypothetical protein
VTAQAAGAEIGASTPQVSSAEQQHHRSLSHYLWSQLLMELLAIRLGEQTTLAKSLVMARIYEVFPLICPICHVEMLIISFITDTHTKKLDIKQHRRIDSTTCGLTCAWAAPLGGCYDCQRDGK